MGWDKSPLHEKNSELYFKIGWGVFFIAEIGINLIFDILKQQIFNMSQLAENPDGGSSDDWFIASLAFAFHTHNEINRKTGADKLVTSVMIQTQISGTQNQYLLGAIGVILFHETKHIIH